MERAESEKWDLYTENRKITGEHAIRGEKSQIPEGRFHKNFPPHGSRKVFMMK